MAHGRFPFRFQFVEDGLKPIVTGIGCELGASFLEGTGSAEDLLAEVGAELGFEECSFAGYSFGLLGVDRSRLDTPLELRADGRIYSPTDARGALSGQTSRPYALTSRATFTSLCSALSGCCGCSEGFGCLLLRSLFVGPFNSGLTNGNGLASPDSFLHIEVAVSARLGECASVLKGHDSPYAIASQ